ncbi:YolD-like family protein [Thomasclavelia sp.]|uniref:YolD-like family protein n=1 Tax=Thomasclavelia sp. TaxID=3025757 RepID=UPI0025DFD2F2|nr:YolD-like family protein [Thomasclavelia sp.]
MNKYDDIINLPHHVSTKHPRMSNYDRAAQFAPFAALTGHQEAIKETARITEKKKELDENQRELINYQLSILTTKIKSKPEVQITYFQADLKKAGGKYITIKTKIEKIDEFKRQLQLVDGTIIAFDDLFSIE